MLHGSGTNGLEGLDIKSDFTVEVDFSKFLTDRLALELIVATDSQELEIRGLSLGNVNHLPPTLTLQWHFMGQDAKFQPYIGAGLNATFFYGKSGAIDNLDLSTSFGLAAQLGADWKVTDKTLFNVDLKYIDISTDVETKAGDKIRASDPPGIDPSRFLAIPLFDLVVFSVLVVAGIRARRDPQAHKRLMLLQTIAILSAAIARWPLAIMQHGPLAFFGANDLYVLLVVGFDLATRGSVHRASLWGALAIVISQPLRLAISGTDAWLTFAHWAVSLVA